jgi:lysylphosphatidylglycerol synthetase-like protein (DUF2156 family)
MHVSARIIGRVVITALLVCAAVVSVTLAVIAFGTDSAFSRFWSPVLFVAALLFIAAIVWCWRSPSGWRVALGACALAVLLSGYLNHFAWRVPEPFGLGLRSVSSLSASADCKRHAP